MSSLVAIDTGACGAGQQFEAAGEVVAPTLAIIFDEAAPQRVFATYDEAMAMSTNFRSSPESDPHAGQPLVSAGPSLNAAAGALVLIHGRGASARGMISLYEQLGVDGLAAVAPQAAGGTWYPQSFLAPMNDNQPWLDSALRKIERVVADLLAAGVPSERIALLGFSQGACLTSEFVALHPRRYGAIMALTGGLIGPAGTPREYAGSLAGTPIFLGTGDPDAHVPCSRVVETRDVFTRLGATVELRRYPGMPHTINDDELIACAKLLATMTGAAPETGR